jgi:hypothetical protein
MRTLIGDAQWRSGCNITWQLEFLCSNHADMLAFCKEVKLPFNLPALCSPASLVLYTTVA